MKNVRNKIISMGLSLLMLTGFTVLSNDFVKSYGDGSEQSKVKEPESFQTFADRMKGESSNNGRQGIQEAEKKINKNIIKGQIKINEGEQEKLVNKIKKEEEDIEKGKRIIGQAQEQLETHRNLKSHYQRSLEEIQKRKDQLQDQLESGRFRDDHMSNQNDQAEDAQIPYDRIASDQNREALLSDSSVEDL